MRTNLGFVATIGTGSMSEAACIDSIMQTGYKPITGDKVEPVWSTLVEVTLIVT